LFSRAEQYGDGTAGHRRVQPGAARLPTVVRADRPDRRSVSAHERSGCSTLTEVRLLRTLLVGVAIGAVAAPAATMNNRSGGNTPRNPVAPRRRPGTPPASRLAVIEPEVEVTISDLTLTLLNDCDPVGDSGPVANVVHETLAINAIRRTPPRREWPTNPLQWPMNSCDHSTPRAVLAREYVAGRPVLGLLTIQ
jgi:hypothetical protein